MLFRTAVPNLSTALSQKGCRYRSQLNHHQSRWSYEFPFLSLSFFHGYIKSNLTLSLGNEFSFNVFDYWARIARGLAIHLLSEDRCRYVSWVEVKDTICELLPLKKNPLQILCGWSFFTCIREVTNLSTMFNISF